MAFVRTKRVDGTDYAQVVENYREDGKVRQRVLLHLGRFSTRRRALAEALLYWQVQGHTAKVAALRKLLDEGKVVIPDEVMQEVEARRAAGAQELRRLESSRSW
jgi:response regulator RpfG family c-di-GMP phosphodiesterase